MARNLDGDLSLAAIARRAARSPYDLHRRFASRVGETLKVYTGRLRLARAAAALVAGRATVLEIALDSGFASHEVFIRAFRRAFGMTPRDYRRRGLGGGDADRHARVVAAVAPCVGLYRRTDEDQPRREPMATAVKRDQRAPQTTWCMRRRIAQSEIAAAIGEMLPKVFAHAQRAGIAFAGPPYARYLEWGPGRLTLEAGMPVAGERVAGEGEIAVAELPGGAVAVAVHEGHYEKLGETHTAIEKWLEGQGLAAGGAPWEVYVTDPGEVPDPKDWRTEVVWPIRG
jgi:AraC family transcriptional regulator